MPRRKKKNSELLLVGEDVKIAVNLILKNFIYNSESKEYEFPSCYNNVQRAYVHELAKQYGLKSKSRGKGAGRYLTVYKRDGSSIIQNDAVLVLSPSTLQLFNMVLSQCPVTVKDRNELLPLVERDRHLEGSKELALLNKSGPVSSAKAYPGIVPVVPCFNTNPAVLKHKASLPVTQYKGHIMQTILKNQVLILTGDTGSGKSTQVPQIILEHYRDSKQPVRIICSQPRRISAVTVAERVAYEINESVGNTVGYQIRLESRSSGKTVLTYCTNGVLIRTLMGGDSIVNTLTHLIIDEVHERDRSTDFLLIVLKELLLQCRNLRLILMSATLDAAMFSKYFNNCPIVSIPGKLFPVKEYYLEDILPQIGYSSKSMDKIHAEMKKKQRQQSEMEKWMERLTMGTEDGTSNADPAEEDNICSSPDPTTTSAAAAGTASSSDLADSALSSCPSSPSLSLSLHSPSQQVNNKYVNECIYNAYHKLDVESALTQFLYFVYNDNVPVDYQHPQTGLTGLMVGALHGMTDIVEKLLCIGANATLRAGDGRTALDFARLNNHVDAMELIGAYLLEYPQSSSCLLPSSSSFSCTEPPPSSPSQSQASPSSNLPTTTTPTTLCSPFSPEPASSCAPETQLLLESYLGSVDEEASVDSQLILSLIKHICTHAQADLSAAILVFLPGYEDIVGLQELLFSDPSCYSQLYILTLHSQMQTSKQKLVFSTPPEGLRKIILSTNIAETSITINDVVYVIDCGKHKEKTYNSISGVTSLQSVWISKACARQRSGRAGRVQSGVCYHMFSRGRYASLPEFQVAEILRTPLTELCLHAKSLSKLLTPPNTTIGDFLSKAIEPPTCIVTRNAVQMLKTIDALDPWEDLTELGRHLLDLPISPRYGKMLIYACVLKCLDPILTIVASLAYRDPFVIPMRASDKCAARNERKLLAGNSASDHMALLRAFQAWQEARARKQQHQFCSSRFISAGTMEMIVATRCQLLSQLRASGYVKPRGASDMKDLNTNSEYWPVIKGCLVAGLYPNLVRVDRTHCVLRSQKEPKVLLHPSSILREARFEPDQKVSVAHTKAIQSLSSDWLVYEEMSRTGNLVHVKTCTAVTSLSVTLFAGPMRLGPECLIPPDSLTGAHTEDSDSEEDEYAVEHSSQLKLDDWILLRGEDNAIVLTLSMRTKWNHLLLKKLRSPHKQLSMQDEMFIVNLVQALIHEDMHYDLRQPSGIGQRPKSTSVDHTYLGDNIGSKSPSPTLSCAGAELMSSSQGQQGQGVKYFIVKLVHTKNLDVSYVNRVWAFSSHTMPKLVQATREGKTVYLLFFNPSNCSIHGYARLVSTQPDPNCKVKASHFVGQNLTPPLPIEWIKRGTLSLSSVKNAINTNNQDLYKIVYNDGQELQTMIGKQPIRIENTINILYNDRSYRL
uniref:Probable ATP-dependent RNA helicase YTHDC2 n=1 Tax=Cacopsylla melanoneura TaxID=428564 RepID=A0A8D8YRQ8_9HEMI